MLHYKLNKKYSEAETLKREISYLSNLINKHVTTRTKHSAFNTPRYPVPYSRGTAAQASAKKNPYKYEKTVESKFPTSRQRVALQMQRSYTLVKKRSKPSQTEWMKRAKFPSAAASAMTSSSGAKRKSLRSQFKVINGTPVKIARNQYTWKRFVRLAGSHKIVLHQSPICFPTSGPRVIRSNKLGRYQLQKSFHSILDGVAKRRKENKLTTHLTSINGILYKVSATTLRREAVHQKDKKKVATSTIRVLGVKYRVDPTGKTLTRIHDSNEAESTRYSGRIDLGRNTYMQTSPGLWTKTGSSNTRIFTSRVVHRSIHRVLTAEEQRRKRSHRSYCMFFNRFGRCLKRDDCPFIHDPSKVAVCTRFLRGTCKGEEGQCPFSHVPEPSKMPVCSYFLRGRCSNDECPYRHVKAPSHASTCPDFLRGFCPKGEKCKKVHTLDCEEFSSSGECSKGRKCPLRHRRRRERKPDRKKGAVAAKEEEATGRLPSFISIASTPPQTPTGENEKKKDLLIYPSFLQLR